MKLNPGTHHLGPADGTLTVRTGRTGAAAKAGHDLVIEVTAWEATIDVADDVRESRVALSADPGSLRVRDGTGGIQSLGEDDKAGIDKTIDDEVLKRRAISFASSEVRPSADGTRLDVRGELELAARTSPADFQLSIDEGGKLTGSATVKQTDWGIKPYSTLFGVLKVADEVTVLIEADVPGVSSD